LDDDPFIALYRVASREERDPSKRESRAYVSRLVIEAYRQEKISRGRVIELSKLLNLPFEEIL
jgi:predicted HTH domain antitoxin